MSATKADLRAAILSSRRAVSTHEHDAEARALAEHATTLAAAGQTVCAYVPVEAEPGSLELVDSLYRRGVRVLLPVARLDTAGSPLPLQWGEYVPGELRQAPFGLREPAEPWLTAEAVGDAVTLLVPALSVDRRGVRLGRGAGFYDRSLPSASPSARLVAVVRDDELVDRLPAEPHDVSMTHALTPRLGLVALGTPDGPGMGFAT
ncbi:5-formyltetrahydrofolate cyclo-ligase [Mycolicibacterium celeriflavum]|uniref:5-formyltetrahydrofolate cyclo-ligase n=1 Tax=Mycolicibacterium celeriflavum TaxID=1249101 RepID=A0A1X0BRH5_MYCCF|nr:5-formyltetrahydrofolate cyclo-ligase [Mycolicibacterium celeriflavum]MCV7237415.1 5-formyltetrahydrofolate cyclo-ligase [Mycolicibacterium celeriflavum]ORA46055.1 5-formyltetrahydrofolate cyclo-ligase [Mycolicibacterium celeriflavum]BBY45949.1 5-formyltetrahydrofolate cyclo-ligase [Mycolicibacterium celeriflavum]